MILIVCSILPLFAYGKWKLWKPFNQSNAIGFSETFCVSSCIFPWLKAQARLCPLSALCDLQGELLYRFPQWCESAGLYGRSAITTLIMACATLRPVTPRPKPTHQRRPAADACGSPVSACSTYYLGPNRTFIIQNCALLWRTKTCSECGKWNHLHEEKDHSSF